MSQNDTKVTVKKVINLKPHSLGRNPKNNANAAPFKVGGILSDFQLAWQYTGSVLKVVDIKEGEDRSCWDFSSITRDVHNTRITCVIEFPISDNRRQSSQQTILVVSYTSQRDSNKASYISFCHPGNGRIFHTVTTPEKVTCMGLITWRRDEATPIRGAVALMSGALALGTKSGNLLIMDIKNYELVDEIYSLTPKSCLVDGPQGPSSILPMDASKIKEKICKIDDDGTHAAVSLITIEKEGLFKNETEIFSLMYIPEALTLAVGLKCGIFQLWDISSLKKLYRSAPLKVPTPVVKFGFQEPCNDPQNFCYLWVLHESDEDENTCLPFAIMYGILFKKVCDIPEYGRCYKNFDHCKKRFDVDIDMERSLNGKCITCGVVSNTPSNMLRHISVNDEDPSKINLFAMLFETWEQNTDLTSHISLVVFDMNQWYKAQMPHQCYQGYSAGFINFIQLDRLSERKSTILDMRIKKHTIRQFLTFNLPEEHSYPSSLSFDTIFLTYSKVMNVWVPGTQQWVIDQITTEGPSSLVNPKRFFFECQEAGLRPNFAGNFSHAMTLTPIQQRNYVLTILLENKISWFLVQCVKEWADGSKATSGCTLPNLMQWAWDCATRIKQTTDAICVPLFDYSGDDLDRENYQKLKHCCQLMNTIKSFLSHILKKYKDYVFDQEQLVQRIAALELITKYFDVIVWCLDFRLLPEKVISSSDKCIPTYIMSLMQYTEQRRDELKTVAMKDNYFMHENCSTIYIIDSIIENEKGGKQLKLQWERESGGISNGQYPPVTLQSLLKMFLMPTMSTEVKHFIMMYFLLDVCDYHRDEDMKKNLLSFATIFFPDSEYLYLIQACWLIDHEKFDVWNLLVDDTVIVYLKQNNKLYETILKSCVCQGQYDLALRCHQVLKVSTTMVERENFNITLLLLNGLITEAYEVLKTNMFNPKKLWRHYFEISDKLGLLKEIFYFPMTQEEENDFISYLSESSNKDADDLKIMFLLSRCRYAEAIDENRRMGSVLPKHGVIGNNTTKQDVGTGRTTTRDLLVTAVSKTLPSVTNELINFCQKERDKIYRHKQITKPIPLSVRLHVDTSQGVPVYKSSFDGIMEAAITATAETWKNFPKLTKSNKNASFVQNTPFLKSTFFTPRKKPSGVTFENSLVRLNSEQKKKDPDEPPSKRKRVMNETLENVAETEGDVLLSAPLEVTKILCTPHVQKRLNKLLQNTPESSPLTSILKSSEASRFRQPQKVGFSVPEVSRRTPVKRALQLDVSRNATASPNQIDVQVEIHSAKKSPEVEKKVALNSEMKRKPNRVDVSVETSIPSANESDSVKDSNDGSYYSLESTSDNLNMISFMLSESSANEATSATQPSRIYLECMSDDDDVMEVEKTIILSSPEPESRVEVVQECTPMETEPSTAPEPVTYSTLHRVEETYIENSSLPAVQISTTGSLNTPSDEVGEELYSGAVKEENGDVKTVENTSTIDNLQKFCKSFEADTYEPVSVIEAEESNVEYVSYTLPIDENTESKLDDEQEISEEEQEISDEEQDISDEEEVSEELEEEATDLSSSSNKDDSDIEILEDETVLEKANLSTGQSKYEPVSAEDDKSDTEVEEEEDVNDEQLSECSYSESSLTEESIEVSGDEEESLQIEETSVLVEDSNDAPEYAESEEFEYEKPLVPETERVVEAQQAVRENAPNINYEELKAIMSTVTAAEAKNKLNETCEVRGSPAKSDGNEATNVSAGSKDATEEQLNTSNEPQMVFYFGENSVTSIGDDVLVDEPDKSAGNLSQSAEHGDTSKVIEELSEREAVEEIRMESVEEVVVNDISANTTQVIELGPVAEEEVGEQQTDVELDSASNQQIITEVSSVAEEEIYDQQSVDLSSEVEEDAYGQEVSVESGSEEVVDDHQIDVESCSEEEEGADVEQVDSKASSENADVRQIDVKSATELLHAVDDSTPMEEDEEVELALSGTQANFTEEMTRIRTPISEPPVEIPSVKSGQKEHRRSIIPDHGTVYHTDLPSPATPRRSSRLASRSTESIPNAVQLREEEQDDDAMSVKSGVSIADSVSSRASVGSVVSVKSNKTSRRKSYSCLELRKSSAKYNFKPLEVINSEDEVSPGLPPVASTKYAASEPGDIPARAGVKRKLGAKREFDFHLSQDDCPAYSEEEMLREIPEMAKINVNEKLEKKQLESTRSTAKTPNKPKMSRLSKFISSTPFVVGTKSPETSDKDETATSNQSTPTKGVSRKSKGMRAAQTRCSRRLSGRIEQPVSGYDDSSSEPPSPAKSVSSVAESTSSKASSVSRRSQYGRRSLYSSMELRKSSVRPNFKPLEVIPSDDEMSFQQPITPVKGFVDEAAVSSSESTRSGVSTRSGRRRELADGDSSVSDASNVSNVSGRRRTAVPKQPVSVGRKKTTPVKSKPEDSSPVTTYASNRRLTRYQQEKMEQALKESVRKNKK